MRQHIRGSSSALPFLFVAVVAATMAMAGESAFARDVAAWIGVGPRMIIGGVLGGDPPMSCSPCDTSGKVQCPSYQTVGCTPTYDGCYCSQDTDCSNHGRGCTKTCVTNGNPYECGTGNTCKNATSASCP